MCCDVNKLSGLDDTKFDCVIYSHVVEILESPETSLREALKFSNKIIIRFFEPPVFDVDCVELRIMNLGKDNVPYLRRKMSKDYYSMILAKLGCKEVTVYRDISTDEVHVLNF